MKKVKKTEKAPKKTPFIKTKVRPNNSVEVEIQKNPAQTLLGKILIYVLVIGMTLLGAVALIYLMIQVGKTI
ncbi:MAG TPA: hypothetical protein PK087_04580 [Bacilli bacterium]|nr:MAG: hypothetical protein BWY97_00731 [Tenericutes bacterium ADurb.BinA124]HNZ50573.1 hypothetical protein [Bacilli bacterium]HOH18580.1 hypothetical protein [Bacilli bacterium]HPN60942.1 hypothetical protein [Bacilli bacterium]HPX84558.1 hypothetical protein [Bacilli bacterium]